MAGRSSCVNAHDTVPVSTYAPDRVPCVPFECVGIAAWLPL